MFDFSLAELGVVGAVALLVLGPEEVVKIIDTIKKVTCKIKDEANKYFEEIKQATGHDELITVIFDDEGKPQKAYDLEKIKPMLKPKE